MKNNEMVISTNFTDKDWDKFSNWLKGILKVEVTTVTFTKKDGTERVMKCTLDPKLLPEAPITEGKKPRKVNEDVIAVYDVEAQGWRSFTIKSIKSVNLSIG
jgi:hypothetical protein